MSILFNDLYGSKYFSVADLNGETPRYRIGKVDVAELKDKDGTTKRRILAYFDGVEKPLALNKTNAKKLAEVYGEDHKKWVGVHVDLYDEDTSLGKGVRLRPVKSAAAGAAAKDMNDEVTF
jgi:hypothetical protein